ncbi:hypothetical protein, partial [Burkholderia sp. Ax-1724]|uniref:hypothetical protein n=1 Tax=Burkholderia sp. Ax-1724 TaxID=2608336 RepID=UPI001422FCEE
ATASGANAASGTASAVCKASQQARPRISGDPKRDPRRGAGGDPMGDPSRRVPRRAKQREGDDPVVPRP